MGNRNAWQGCSTIEIHGPKLLDMIRIRIFIRLVLGVQAKISSESLGLSPLFSTEMETAGRESDQSVRGRP